MSSLRVNQIKAKLLALFEAFLDVSDLSPNDSEREQKILTRCLAAAAVYYQTGCTPQQAAEAVWDGGDDNGLDAVYFDAAESRVIFIQSKWINKGSGEPSAKDIGVFTKGVRDLVEQEASKFSLRLQTKLKSILGRVNSPGTSLHLMLVTTGGSEIAKHGADVVDVLLKELNDDGMEPIASKESWGIAEVYKNLSADANAGSVTIEATLEEWAYIPKPYIAYFGIVDGAQLAQLWKEHGRRLVAKNIRSSLGATDVNTQIKATVASQPEHFWYFNNGITLIADEVIKAPGSSASRTNGHFRFKNASIVNGAQTVSSLGRLDDQKQLANVRVPIRVILLKDAPATFGDDVTRTNNLQNRVESRDFVAQDPEQARVRQEMAMEGIDYQYIRSDEAISSPSSCELLEVTTALACASADANLAVQVKTGIGRFFSDLSKPPYRLIFNPSLTGTRAFNVTYVHRKIDEWIDEKKKQLAKRSGPSWGTLVHGNRILATAVFAKYLKLSNPSTIADFAKSFDKNELASLCETAFTKMEAKIVADYPTKALAVLFKNPTLSKEVYDAAIT